MCLPTTWNPEAVLSTPSADRWTDLCLNSASWRYPGTCAESWFLCGLLLFIFQLCLHDCRSFQTNPMTVTPVVSVSVACSKLFIHTSYTCCVCVWEGENECVREQETARLQLTEEDITCTLVSSTEAHHRSLHQWHEQLTALVRRVLAGTCGCICVCIWDKSWCQRQDQQITSVCEHHTWVCV